MHEKQSSPGQDANRKRRLLALAMLAVAICSLPLLHPYSRQSILGPTIEGQPLWYWQSTYLPQNATKREPDSVFSKVEKFLGIKATAFAGTIPVGHPDMCPFLLGLLEDPDEQLRWYAVNDLGSHHAAPEVVSALRGRLEDSNHRVRVEAIRQLQQFPAEPETLELLGRLLHDPDASVRNTAAKSIAQFGPAARPLLPRLKRELDAPDRETRLLAAQALWKVDGPSESVISTMRGVLAHPDPTIRRNAMYSLWLIGKDARAAYPEAVLRAARDSDDSVRVLAVSFLGSCGRDALPPLILALQDQETSVCRAAIYTLGDMGAVAEEAIPHLEARRDNEDDSVRRAVAEALFQIDPDRFPAPVNPQQEGD